MENKRLLRFYLISLVGIIIASSYPIYMGLRVLGEMKQNGAVPIESYPKYIIPYTPIALALIFGVLLLPAFIRLFKRFNFLMATILSTGIFFLAERLMETKILVQSQELVFLESWQMALCYVPPEKYQSRTWEAVDVLLGGYSPAFKLHFYIISVVLIVSLLNSFYGFANMICSGNKTRKRALTIQTILSLAFLGMCIWACFTSFYRTGEITVSALSAILMAVFFILFGMTMGIFVSSFTLKRDKKLSMLIPAIVASTVTLIMYIGEMILLNGNLYRFGAGILLTGLPGIILAPVDILIIILSGALTALICKLVGRS